jgi:hypothetical protein
MENPITIKGAETPVASGNAAGLPFDNIADLHSERPQWTTRQVYWAFCVLVLSLTFSFSTGAKEMAFLDPTSSLDSVEEAQVKLMNPSVMFRSRMDDTVLVSKGCGYSTKDRSRIDSLIDIMKHSDLKVVDSNNGVWTTEARESIFFKRSDGTFAIFFFSQKYNNVDTIHGYYYGFLESKKINLSISLSFLNELILWSVDTGEIPDQNAENQSSCQYFHKIAENVRGEMK